MRLHIFCKAVIANRLELAARIARRLDSQLKMVAREIWSRWAATTSPAPF